MAPKKSDKGKKKAAENKASGVTPDKLIEQGNVALSNMEVELAEKFFSRALSMAPQDTNIMDALADVQIQLGESDKAVQLLLQSTSIAPSVNPFKWLFLGQLQSEAESVKSYRTGIELLTSLLNNESEADARQLLSKQIAKAHCSIVEIYLTDLCYDEDAETTCEKEVASALALCPDSLDGLQTLASLRLSQVRKGEAAKIISSVFDRISHIRQVVSARTVVEEISGAAEPQEFQDLPEMEFSIATVKLLIECASEDPLLYSKALDLGSSLLDEDEDNVELWYLMGVASLGGLSPCDSNNNNNNECSNSTNNNSIANNNTVDLESAQEHFLRAQSMMDRLREEAAEQEGPDAQFMYQEQYELVQEHLRLIATLSQGGEGGMTMQTSNNGAAPVDEEYEDNDDEEEGMEVDK